MSFTFGVDVVSKFLSMHDLDLICRAHQVVEDGYEFFAKRSLVTLFSAPNYCGEFDNAGGMMSVDENLMCSFQVGLRGGMSQILMKTNLWNPFPFLQILKPSEKKAKYQYSGTNAQRPQTPQRNQNQQLPPSKRK